MLADLGRRWSYIKNTDQPGCLHLRFSLTNDQNNQLSVQAELDLICFASNVRTVYDRYLDFAYLE